MSIKLGFCSTYPAPGILERIASDWDWIWLDGQHGQLCAYGDMLGMVRACNLVNRPAFIRVPGHESNWIGMALDMKADGVIVPQIETVEQAQAAVLAAKFPPLGNRSYGARRAIDFSGRLYHIAANTETRLICQIESLDALSRVDEIAAVKGVDALLLGPDDMILRMGGAMDASVSVNLPLLEPAIRALGEACQRHGKEAFAVGVHPDMMRLYQKHGYRWIVAGGDVSLLANGSKSAAAAARATLQSAESPVLKSATSSPY